MGLLIGRKVLSASINQEKDFILLETDKGPLYLHWEGECCANCFLAHVSGAKYLINAFIISAENADTVSDEIDHYEVIDTFGTKIKTDKGFVDFETRTEHNGYYSGHIIVLDTLDKYRPRETDKLKPLEDF